MLNFKSFLKEELIVDEVDFDEDYYLSEAAATKGTGSDDKGKMHELLLSKYLHPEKRLPDHHRSESENEDHAGTPDQVHDRLRKKIGDAAYHEIDSHAKQTAEAVHKELHDEGHVGKNEHISNVFWTSNPDKESKAGDHEKTTGVKDVNANADLIVRIADKHGNTHHVGVSAKYGSQKPNYRNPGIDSLEKLAGLESGSTTKHMAAHKANMDAAGYTGSADNRNYQTKVDEMAAKGGADAVRQEWAHHEAKRLSGQKLSSKETLMHKTTKDFLDAHDGLSKSKQSAFVAKAAARGASARESNLNARKNIAKDLHAGFSKHSPEHITEMIRGMVSPPTHIPHIIAHSKVNDDGSAESDVKPANDIASKHFANFDMSTVRPHVSNSAAVVFKAIHKKTGKLSNVATINVKSSSGAHKGTVGAVTLK